MNQSDTGASFSLPPNPNVDLQRLIQAESGGNANAVSPTGAQGLTQIQPATGASPGLGVQPLQNNSEAENLRFGSDYKSALDNRYGGNTQLGASAYNYGFGNVDAALKQSGGDQNAAFNSLPQPVRDYANKVAGVSGGAPTSPGGGGALPATQGVQTGSTNDQNYAQRYAASQNAQAQNLFATMPADQAALFAGAYNAARRSNDQGKVAAVLQSAAEHMASGSGAIADAQNLSKTQFGSETLRPDGVQTKTVNGVTSIVARGPFTEQTTDADGNPITVRHEGVVYGQDGKPADNQPMPQVQSGTVGVNGTVYAPGGLAMTSGGAATANQPRNIGAGANGTLPPNTTLLSNPYAEELSKTNAKNFSEQWNDEVDARNKAAEGSVIGNSVLDQVKDAASAYGTNAWSSKILGVQKSLQAAGQTVLGPEWTSASDAEINNGTLVQKLAGQVLRETIKSQMPGNRVTNMEMTTTGTTLPGIDTPKNALIMTASQIQAMNDYGNAANNYLPIWKKANPKGTVTEFNNSVNSRFSPDAFWIQHLTPDIAHQVMTQIQNGPNGKDRIQRMIAQQKFVKKNNLLTAPGAASDEVGNE
jgi:soluble lytic murein transglycosylase-like protein